MVSLHSSNKVHFGSISFSEKEIKDLIKAWLAISFVFAVLLSKSLEISLFTSFIISSLTVGVGFIFHELGHKILAQKYGAWAEFRSFDQMLLLAIVMSFFGFVFIAPGAVMISGRTIGKSRNGKISAMGPMMNFIMALLFLPLAITYKEGILSLIGNYGFTINTWLGLFNLIPFAMFDGKKILNWNKVVYGILVAAAISLMLIRYLI
ncbi:MAG: site-2 protease family protein [Nanoarchaeota archaeon]|nr:site-2 protease family protein [Nanoarchaeota archaeon]